MKIVLGWAQTYMKGKRGQMTLMAENKVIGRETIAQAFTISSITILEMLLSLNSLRTVNS